LNGKNIKINGVKFRFSEIEWEGACGVQGGALPVFKDLRQGRKADGRMIQTSGWAAKIGTYYLIISERGGDEGVFDYTLVPGRPKIKIK
jgi:hypothetical protein